MGGSAPQVPVPSANTTAASSQGYNQLAAEQSQAGSMVNQQTPFGNLTYTPTGTGPGGFPTYSATTQLSPQEQYLLGVGQTTQGLAGTQAAELLGGANYGASPNLGSMTSGLTGQILGADIGGVQPFFNQQTEQLQSQLANQGLTPTDPAYQVAMNNMLQSQNQSVMGFLGSAEPQAFSQAQSAYELPLQTAASLYSIGAPASLSGNLINTPTASVNPADVTGAVNAQNSAAQAQAQIAEQQYGSQMAGMFGLGTAALKALPFMGPGISSLGASAMPALGALG
ncbi:MAG TPA: hypothetical protein VGT08_01700 [Terracidiphilus sp.]|nr:hypothetical protein [Terracidiphilus sp.]